MRKRKALKRLMILLLLLLAAAGGLFFARPYVKDMQRKAAEETLIEKIENGEREIELPAVPEVEGEAFDEMEEISQEYVAPDSLDSEDSMEPLEKKTVVGYGLLEIPVIELEMPVVQGADAYSLRAAAGWWPKSAELGNAGNCVIFGHRMVTYGRHFNRLDEVNTGDELRLYNTEGEGFRYIVTGTEEIEPSKLMETLYAHNEGFNLTLVTCTPTGVGSHRLLVYAQLENSGTGEE